MFSFSYSEIHKLARDDSKIEVIDLTEQFQLKVNLQAFSAAFHCMTRFWSPGGGCLVVMEMDPLICVVQKRLQNGLASLCQATVSKVLNSE